MYAKYKLSRNLNRAKAEVGAAMRAYDKDGNGTMDFNEFLQMFATSPDFAFNQEGFMPGNGGQVVLDAAARECIGQIGASSKADDTCRHTSRAEAAQIMQGAVRGRKDRMDTNATLSALDASSKIVQSAIRGPYP